MEEREKREPEHIGKIMPTVMENIIKKTKAIEREKTDERPAYIAL